MTLVAALHPADVLTDPARPRFEALIDSAMRLRNSIAAEVLLIAFVYAVGVVFVWRTQMAVDVKSWYGVTVGGILQPSAAVTLVPVVPLTLTMISLEALLTQALRMVS